MSDPAALRALFIVPPTGKFIREDRCQTPIKKLKTVALRPPIDMLYSAAAARAGGAECRIVDFPAQGLGWADLERLLLDWRPELLAMSITTPSFEDDMKAAALCKRVLPEARTAAKGAHFNALDLEAMQRHPHLDMCMRGEYEETCMELARRRPLEEIPGLTWRAGDGRIVRNPPRPLLQNLDDLPFPARDLIDNAPYFRPDTGELQTTVITNRGCPFSCVFCLANQVSGNKNRARSVENILAELEECVERHGIRNFLFRSDLFTANRKWVRDLCQGIRRRGLDIEWACNSRVDTLDEETLREMKSAGCWVIAFGVESGDQAALDRMNKKARAENVKPALDLCRKVGVKSSIYILMGFPWDSRESIEANMRFTRRIDPDYLEIFYVYPFPGTKLREMCIEAGTLKEGEIPRAAYDSPCMPTQSLSIEELARMRARAMRDFYLRPAKIWRTLRSARNPRELFNYIKYGFIQLAALFGSNGELERAEE